MLARNLLDALGRVPGLRIDPDSLRPLPRGQTETFRVESASGPLFVKATGLDFAPMLEAEAEALAALREAGGVAVPGVCAAGRCLDGAYLALEWIEFGAKSPAAERELGRGLAEQHACSAERYGWHRANTIGATPQPNPWTDGWLEFYRDERLAFQLRLAARNGLDSDVVALGERLIRDIGAFLAGHVPPPALLHGDLWGGNWGATRTGAAVIFDPASYFGDREADLAMTRLFGGFGADFYRAYEQTWPLPKGWRERVDLYNVYHVLNHFNLFGGAYASQAVSCLERLTARL